MTSSRLARRFAAGIGLLAVAATGIGLSAPVAHAATGAGAGADSDLDSRFTMAVLPDTQFYSRYAGSNFEPKYGTNPFAAQTQWIADHQKDLNIAFTTQLGDVVDQVSHSDQWDVGSQAMSTLEDASAPYSILAGNHDVLDSTDTLYDNQYDLADEPYLQTFPTSRAAKQATYGGSDPTGFNEYHVFEAEGQQFLVLAISWRASDATFDWANQVIRDHPSLPVILTSHDMIGIDTDGVTPYTSVNGERVWDKLIADNDQIFLTLNGHYHGSGVLTRQNNAGHAVTQVLIDYQMSYEGGDGYMGLYEFDLTKDVIHVSTFSPWIADKSADQLTSYDEPVLKGDAQQFDVDFSGRFDGFTSTFGPGSGKTASLTDRALATITEGFPGVPTSTQEEAGNAQDYIDVDGTLAHWQPSQTPGELAEGDTVDDLAGGNDLTRQTIAASGSTSAQPGDVTIADKADRYSPSDTSICFANSDKQTNRFSYLTTAADADVNNADFSRGYTIETFIEMDKDWTSDANSWSKALVRSGNRSKLDGMPWTQWDYTASPAALGISNLREFQWTEIGQNATQGDKTAWSGEIMPGTWSHVALVNDPATAETTMYVNGAPVLRTAQDTIGQSFNEGMSWIIGSDWVNDAASNGWNGCVGETRIVDHPLSQDQWLTARPDLTTFAVTDAPAEAIDPATSTVTISGTGTPRASVESADATLSATVDEDGTWTLTVPTSSLDAQGVTESLTQGFGERRSDPVEVTLRLAEAPAPSPEPSDPVSEQPNPEESTPGVAPADTDARNSAEGSDQEPADDLAHTGFSIGLPIGLIVVLAAAGSMLVAGRKNLSH